MARLAAKARAARSLKAARARAKARAARSLRVARTQARARPMDEENCQGKAKGKDSGKGITG